MIRAPPAHFAAAGSAGAEVFLKPPVPSYAWQAVLRNGALYLVALASVPLLSSSYAIAPVAVMPLLGLAMYRLTIVMHDCVHGAFFPGKRTNRWVGVIAGAASGIEYHAFARLHRRHHEIFGEPGDPQGPDYLISASASRAAIAWHLFRPLIGYNLFKLTQVFAEMRHERSQPEKNARSSFAIVAAMQVVAAIIASSGMRIWWLAALPLISAATFGLFFAQLRGFAEHVAMPGVDPRGFVRSHRSSVLDRIFLCDLNFNLHREHHRHPSVPSCWLPELHCRLATADAERHRLNSSMIATVWRRLAAARRVSRLNARGA